MSIYVPPDYQTDPAKVKRLGVIVGDTLYILNHTDPRRGTTSIVSVLYYATHGQDHTVLAALFGQQCGALWLINTRPGYLRELAATAMGSETFTAHELSADGALAGLVIQQRGADGKGHGQPVGVYAPQVNDAWGLTDALLELSRAHHDITGGTLARTIAEGLALAAYTLGVQLRFSPSYTGLIMLRQELGRWERRNGELPELSAEWRERLQELRPTYIQWRAALPTPERGDDYLTLHKYDRNSSFVSSAREVGVGDPEPTSEYMPGCPGVYMVTYWEETTGRYELPGPFHVGAGVGAYPNDYAAGTWVWEPQLRLALKHGWCFDIAEGYYWPRGRKHDLFRSWQGRIWEARNTARQWGAAGTIAEAIIKKAGVATIGRLVQREGRAVMSMTEAKARGLRMWADETDERGAWTGNVEVFLDVGRSDLIQPGWWSSIISGSNERLFNALYSFAPDSVLAYVDGLHTLAPHAELDGLRTKPGAFRSQGTVRVPVGDIERLNALGPGELVKALHRYEEEGQHNGEE